MHGNTSKPITHQRDLAKLPRALRPLVERPQWCVWRWTQQPNGRWQKPPYQALDPQRHASTRDSDTWSDYDSALATVQAGKADGISFVMTEADSFCAFDLDHCRHPGTGSIDIWAQNFLDVARHTYAEVTPSGTGCRIWGLTGEGTDPVNRKFTLEIDGKQIAAELFRRTPKALTVTGYRLDTIRELTSLDKAFGWASVWGERRKAQTAEAAAATQIDGHGFNGGGSGHDVDDIERIVCEGAPAGGNRSDLFHMVVGHYLGCGWSLEQIDEHLRQFPDGIGARYFAEDRLAREIARSAGKYAAGTLPLFEIDGWDAKAPAREQPAPEPSMEPEPEPDEPPVPEQENPPELEENPELEDEELEDDDKPPQPDPKLPKLYTDWEADPDPVVSWLIKHLVPTCGVGLLSGQWGTYKTFVVLDLLLASIATGQPFLGHIVKRQCGALLIAAEGANQVRLRRDAVVREKCGDVKHLPFTWYKQTPSLLQKGAAKELIAMARQADAALQEEFGLPLGVVIIDTMTACAGYSQAGGDNDGATGQAIMNVLKAVAEACNCFVFGVAHFGKNVEAGTIGTVVKENASDVILACLGEKQLNGSVTNTRLVVRKNKGGPQGQEFPFTMRPVTAPEPDPDGDPVTSLVVDWQPPGAPAGTRPESESRWTEGCRRDDQRAPMLRLERALLDALTVHGVEQELPPDGPVVRMVSQEIVRTLFYDRTPVTKPDRHAANGQQQFKRALARAEERRLAGFGTLGGVAYLWSIRPDET